MKIFLFFLIITGNVYSAHFESRAIAKSVIDLLEALKKSKVLNKDFTTHKLEIEKFEGKGAGFNIIIKVYDPHKPTIIGKRIHCQTFYNKLDNRMVPDVEKVDCQ